MDDGALSRIVTSLQAIFGYARDSPPSATWKQPPAHSASLILLTLGPLPAEEGIVGQRSLTKEKLIDQ